MNTNYSIIELVRCVEREIAWRKRVYRRAVAAGRMDPELAQAEIEMMETVAENLRCQQSPKLF
jgi:hypothetical protein